MGSLPPPKRILLLTNSEHGQANVFLATAYALLTADSNIEVHFASFPRIHSSVLATSAHALQAEPSARPIIFRPISGIDMVTAWSRPSLTAERESLAETHSTLHHAVRRMLLLLHVTLPWTGPEFHQITNSITDICNTVQPVLTAVDPVFSPGLTVLRHLGARFVVLSPNTIKDFSMPFQPDGEALWRYPCIGSPHPFPVPVAHIPANILLVVLALVIARFFDFHRREVQEYLAQHGGGAVLTTLNDLSLDSKLGIKFLVANLREIEFPLRVVPEHVVPCGPMLRPTLPLKMVDAELAGWLAKGPTVYINLGTHVFLDEDAAVEMAGALRIMFRAVDGVLWRDGRLRGLRVLWKLSRKGKYEVREKGCRVWETLGREMEDGRVRVVEWIDAEPSAVLESRTIVCAVHHGGANSFLEAVDAGVPQVVLPVWMDTYDFARRAEVLGIGRWGNQREEGVVCRAKELGDVLIDVLVGGRASVYRSRARELGELCRRQGGGRVRAARAILREVESVDYGPGGEHEL
ncbi:hypothetical protein OQA88_2290 [Cercophora sp. LCS_1]